MYSHANTNNQTEHTHQTLGEGFFLKEWSETDCVLASKSVHNIEPLPSKMR